MKIAVTHDSDLGDQGWEDAGEAGRQYLIEHLPEAQVDSVENVPPGQALQDALAGFGDQGYDLVIATGSTNTDDVLKIAEQYPDTVFFTAGQDRTAPNVSQYYAAIEEAHYLMGYAAGKLTESDTIGYVYSFDFLTVRRPMIGFGQGVRASNPDATVRPLPVNSFFDPPLETQAANAVTDAGADVVVGANGGPAVGAALAGRDVPFVGFGVDFSTQFPDVWVGSWLFNWGPMWLEVANSIADGTYEPSVVYRGLAEEGLTLAPWGEWLDPELVAELEDLKGQIESGELDVWAGPIVDTEGNERVPAGGTLEDLDVVRCCDWLSDVYSN